MCARIPLRKVLRLRPVSAGRSRGTSLSRYNSNSSSLRRLSRASAGGILALAIALPIGPVAAEEVPDPFAGAPTGRLFITLEVHGSGRKDLPNKVEWSRLKTTRKLDLELAMVVPGPSLAPSLPVGGSNESAAGMPPGLEAMGRAMKSCEGDEACQKRAAAAFAVQMMASPKVPRSMKLDDKRYVNWIVDRRGACARGTVVIEDEGDGVNIAPPSPAAPYRFTRTGRLTLPVEAAAVIEKVCQADVSIDTQSNRLSLRLAGFGFPTPVTVQGQAFTSERSVPFLEGAGKIEILDQPFDPDGRTGAGSERLAKLGSVSHNSGATVAPVSGVLTWRFVRD